MKRDTRVFATARAFFNCDRGENEQLWGGYSRFLTIRPPVKVGTMIVDDIKWGLEGQKMALLRAINRLQTPYSHYNSEQELVVSKSSTLGKAAIQVLHACVEELENEKHLVKD